MRIAALEAELVKAEAVRREMFNQIQELRGNIRVFCRVRPLSTCETSQASALLCLDAATVHLRLGPEKSSSHEFNRVFNQESTQEDVFQEVSGLVQSALDGYNVCLFSYGQTGSGKTAAFLLPLLARKLKVRQVDQKFGEDDSACLPIALVMAPTRELAQQIHGEATKFCNRSPFRTVVVYGGSPLKPQLVELSKGTDLIVATPGRLIDMMDQIFGLYTLLEYYVKQRLVSDNFYAYS